MNIVTNIKRRDYKNAIQFAIKGMHFDWYLNRKFMLDAYGKYFWYMELNRVSHIYAAYSDDNKLIGVLLAEIYGEPKRHNSWTEQFYVRLVDMIQNIFYKDGSETYEKTCCEQKNHFFQRSKPDGEIIFLAANPDAKAKGVGTALLKALEEDAKGKTIFLFTDDVCTYQFYEHRGFERVEEKAIVMDLPKGKVPLTCFVYSKIL